MRIIIIWLWGAALSSMWWGAILAMHPVPLAFATLCSILTLIVFGFFCKDNWRD